MFHIERGNLYAYLSFRNTLNSGSYWPCFYSIDCRIFWIWGQNGQVPEETTGPVVTTPAPPVSNTKIVALGDSFTLGYPLDAAHSWTQRMADVLKVEVINKGKVNQTSKDLLARFDADVVAEKPAQVIIFAGMGDGIEGVNRDEVQTNIKAMVEKAKANEIIPILALPFHTQGLNKTFRTFGRRS